MSTRLILTLALVLGGCFLGRAGSGAFAQRCFGHAEMLVAELDAHRETSGSYPEHLEALPSFSQIPRRHREAFSYEVGDDGYVLRFFHGPCMNVCEYESPPGRLFGHGGDWRCHGAC